MEYCWVLWSTGCILREGRDNGGGYCGILQLLGGTECILREGRVEGGIMGYCSYWVVLMGTGDNRGYCWVPHSTPQYPAITNWRGCHPSLH